jgi:putative acetyltransferase
VSAFAIRAEEQSDWTAVGAVHEAAFRRPQEARLVEALRASGQARISLVAVADGAVVGHVLFSPVAASGLAANACVGLAPLAVLPAHQRRGIGGALANAGLEACRRAGFAAAVVLGDPAYYRRFGFVSARQFGLSSEYDAPDDAFMALELRAGGLAGAKGPCRYADEFRLV